MNQFCSFCGAPAHRGTGGARGFCARHYYAVKNYLPLSLEYLPQGPKPVRCAAEPTPVPGARWVPLACGRFTLVDESDFERVSQHSWYRAGRYAVRDFPVDERIGPKSQRLHHFIIGSSGLIDHVSGDSLDNRRLNLRSATRAENAQNRCSNLNKTSSQFKGVFPQAGKWRVKIKMNGVQKHVGYFVTEAEAALAYNEAALKHFGEFARLNEIGVSP